MVLLLPIGNEVYGYSQQPHDYLHNIEALIWGLSSAMGSKWIGIDPLTMYMVGAVNIRVQWSASMPGHLYNLQMQTVTVGSGV
ncbi:hypothetical protein Tco_0720552 [Tanacetum coccineum]